MAEKIMLEVLIEAANACADDLEAELKDRWASRDQYPSQQRKFERDMESVRAVRAAIAEIEGEK